MKQAELDLSDARRTSGALTGEMPVLGVMFSLGGFQLDACLPATYSGSPLLACAHAYGTLQQVPPVHESPERSACCSAGSSKRLEESIAALQLETSSVARALKETIAARERQLVEHDVLKLQVGHVLVAPSIVSAQHCMRRP